LLTDKVTKLQTDGQQDHIIKAANCNGAPREFCYAVYRLFVFILLHVTQRTTTNKKRLALHVVPYHGQLNQAAQLLQTGRDRRSMLLEFFSKLVKFT